MLESDIEKYLGKRVHQRGGECLKLKLESVRGFPDRTIVLPGGKLIFVELKRPGGRVSKAQERWINRLRSLGFSAGVVWDRDDVEMLLEGV